MFGKFLNFIRRPDINEQNTGHEAFQQYQGYSRAGVNGNTGFTYRHSIRAFQPANIALGNTLKLNDPTATGNNSSTPYLSPLTDNGSTRSI